MKKNYFNKLFAIVIIMPFISVNASESTENLLNRYQSNSAKIFSAEAGKALWGKDINGRSCVACHGSDVKKEGRHLRTGKIIQPMAPSVNLKRFSNIKKIEKWFLRNCKWTFRRECTIQEKGDILRWLDQQ